MSDVMLTDKTVKTKKPHTCYGCSRKFPAGTKMQYQAGVWQGDFWTSYFCLPCNELWDQIDWGDCDEGLYEGELIEYFEELTGMAIATHTKTGEHFYIVQGVEAPRPISDFAPENQWLAQYSKSWAIPTRLGTPELNDRDFAEPAVIQRGEKTQFVYGIFLHWSTGERLAFYREGDERSPGWLCPWDEFTKSSEANIEGEEVQS